MPISFATKRRSELSFPEIGTIRKGKKETRQRQGGGGTYEVPVELTFFRLVFTESETTGSIRSNILDQTPPAEDVFRKFYGEEPHQINVILPFNVIEKNWSAWFEAYTGGRMIARAGSSMENPEEDFFTYLVDNKTGKILVKDGIELATGKPKKYEHGEIVGYTRGNNPKPIKCSPVGRLRVIIREIGRLAYFTVKTGSIYDIINIEMQLRSIQEIAGGRLAAIPLIMKRVPRDISVPKDDGSAMRVKKYLIDIEADPRWVAEQIRDMTISALPAGSSPDALETNLLPEPTLYYQDESEEEQLLQEQEISDQIMKKMAALDPSSALKMTFKNKSLADMSNAEISEAIEVLKSGIPDWNAKQQSQAYEKIAACIMVLDSRPPDIEGEANNPEPQTEPDPKPEEADPEPVLTGEIVEAEDRFPLDD